MSRTSAFLALAEDVWTYAARRRVLWIYLALGALAALLAVLGIEVLPAEGDPGASEVHVVGLGMVYEVSEPAARAVPTAVTAAFQIVTVNAMRSFGVLLGVLATVTAVSGAFEPGRAELVVPRPLSRAGIVLARFGGVLSFGVVLALWPCALAVLAAGVRHGVWLPELLLVGPPLALKFGVLAAVCTLAVVVTGSRALGVAVTVGVWFVSWSVNSGRGYVENVPPGDQAAFLADLHDQVVWAQRLFPQVTLLDQLALSACGVAPEPLLAPWYSPAVVLVQAAVWVALPLVVCALVLSRRDL